MLNEIFAREILETSIALGILQEMFWRDLSILTDTSSTTTSS